ncbi:MAG: hypothetical protein ABI882_04560 [Acidobacteriota bacterium]
MTSRAFVLPGLLLSILAWRNATALGRSHVEGRQAAGRICGRVKAEEIHLRQVRYRAGHRGGIQTSLSREVSRWWIEREVR